MRVPNWQMLLAHRHWITLDILGRSIRLCARCSGAVMGFLSMFVLLPYVRLPLFSSLPSSNQVLLCFLLACPAGFDWMTQTWGLRKSRNDLRLATGFLEGAGVALVSLVPISTIAKFMAVTGLGTSIVVLGLSGTLVRRYL